MMILRLFIAAAAGFATIVLIARIERVRIIMTDSAAPAGIYRTVDAQFTHGELVLACLPADSARLALRRSYLGAGNCPAGAEPIAKVLGALPGDMLQLSQAFVAIDGIRIPDSLTVARDTMGRPLQHAAWGTYRVADGQVWLFGFNNPRSWDGRYFGPVPTANVLSALKPIITW
jgi:conjugative transfer signal peptidase TraF